jgi:hypothetical protein
MKLRCLVIALALLAAFASDSWGQSNRPALQTAPIAEPQPAKHGDEKAAAESSESSKETAEGTEYWIYRGYKVKITDGMLVLFTLALVAISLSQAIFLKGTLAATAVAADAARDQTLFAKLERPYLYIFNASGLKIDLDQEDPFYYLKYSVANYGKTPARVESASIGINVGVAPEQPDAAIGWHDFLVSPFFVTGERRDNPTKSIPDYIEIGDYADENTGPCCRRSIDTVDKREAGRKHNRAQDPKSRSTSARGQWAVVSAHEGVAISSIRWRASTR